MAKPKTQVVIFALIKDRKILVEKRPVPGFSDDQYLIPGGTIDDQENLEEALRRETREELGVVPIEFQSLTDEGIEGIFGNTLKPFVVTSWQGDIPEVNLDKDDQYSLEWVDIETLNSEVESTRRIIKAVRRFNDTSKT